MSIYAWNECSSSSGSGEKTICVWVNIYYYPYHKKFQPLFIYLKLNILIKK